MKSKSRKKKIVLGIIIVNGLLTFYSMTFLFYYYVGIFCVNPGQFGELIWCTAPAGTIFPLPRESGRLMALTSSHSIIDYLIYLLIIQTNLMYLLPLIFGGLTFYFVMKLLQMQRK
ncbi:MAG: hypothetical protein ACXAC6_11705 [Candidatus Hodarchaeales archaeon]|jgi:hypothetical protein